jgi:hypothetical protein
MSTFDFLFFFIFMKVQVKKNLSLVGKKIKSFILIDMGETRKKKFYSPVFMNIHYYVHHLSKHI